MGSVFALRLSSARFLPLLDLDRPVQVTRRFTTLADGQRKAIFHFYFRARPRSGWLPVGRVEWDSLPDSPAGEPTLELGLTPEHAGSLLLRLRERTSGASRTYRIRLPVFRRLPPPAEPAEPAVPAGRKGPRRRAAVALAIAAVMLAAGAAVVFRFSLLRGLLPGKQPASTAQNRRPQPAGEAKARGDGAVRQPAPVEPPTPEPPPQPRARAQEATGPLSHRVQWGDTLWQITQQYYGNPYLYDLLAGENALADPNLLIPGTEIRLPPRIDDQDRKQ